MTNKNNLALPVAIVVAGALIAFALYYVNNNKPVAGDNGGINLPKAKPAPKPKDIPGVQDDDHIIGNKDARLVIVEYSDPECPFCARFHKTMQKVVKNFDKKDVAWVYRDLPIPSLHSKAIQEATALECAGKLGGNGKFWEYTNKLYENTPSNNGLDLAQLPVFAKEVGLNVDEFNKCLKNKTVEAEVRKDMQIAQESGAQGTPYSIILYKGQQLRLPGAIPYEDYQAQGKLQPGMESIIKGVLAQ